MDLCAVDCVANVVHFCVPFHRDVAVAAKSWSFSRTFAHGELKPVVKWAGGKRSIMDKILAQFPIEFNDYHEPFVGGASVAMEMTNRQAIKDKRVYISDLMEPLMNVYNVLQDNVEELIQELKRPGYENDKDSFLVKRARFNEVKKNVSENKVECAGLFLYLNRTCYNGMYRENNNGGYNVPFGRQKNPLICNE